MRLKPFLLAAFIVAAVPSVHAQIDPCAQEYLAAYAEGRRIQTVEGCAWGQISDMSRADKIQAEVVNLLSEQGSPVGYKVTNAQDGRVIGVILDFMILPSGSEVDLDTGARLLGEGDLMIRVKSDAINSAKTLEEVAAHIDQVIPLIESSDMMLPQGTPRSKATWTASNGNARWAVTGDAINVSERSPSEVLDLLGSIEVSLFDSDGSELQRSGMRNHPLKSVLDVLEDMQRRGNATLKAGDLISLGNFGRPRFPNAGTRYRAVFHGLANTPPEVTASYR